MNNVTLLANQRFLSKIRLVPRIAGAVLAIGALGCLCASSSFAAYGDNFEVAAAQGALPGSKAFWGGTCDLSKAPLPGLPIPGGYGTRPLNPIVSVGGFLGEVRAPSPTKPRDCIDPGVTEPAGSNPNPWYVAPLWRQAPVTQAGAHPDASALATITRDTSGVFGTLAFPAGSAKDVVVDLPPGLIGNPEAVAACTPEQFESIPPNCPPASQVGVADIRINFTITVSTIVVPVYRLVPRPGHTAEFGIPQVSVTAIRVQATTRSDEDFGLTTFVPGIPTAAPFLQQSLTFWGVPWASSHDEFRPKIGANLGNGSGVPAAEQSHYDPSWGEIQPFITNPTRCTGGELVTQLRLNSWQKPNDVQNYTAPAPAVTGCEALEFNPKISAEPATHAASTPSGYEVNVKVPQNNQAPALASHDPSDTSGAPAYFKGREGLATPSLRDTVVTLPEGVSLTAGSADGLESCSTQQIGLLGTNFPDPSPIRFDKSSAACPDGSKVGTVEIDTPLLEDPLSGEVYLAAQGDNPFKSMFAIYLVAHDEERDLTIKLAGKVEPDPVTGQLKSTFTDNPQLPFERFTLQFKGGSRAPLVTPSTCGIKTTVASLTPWSSPVAAVSDSSFKIDSGPGGSTCASTSAARPFKLGLSAGSQNPVAGASSPFSIRVTRPDGAQELQGLTLRPPAGITAALKGVPYCSEAAIAAAKDKSGEAEQASSSCSPASQIGTVQTGAGAGASPYYAPGKLYLAGPYKGGPISVVAITPAVAGPFDLGNVVVRAALQVNPTTAQITATTDQIPTILEGVPLAIRDIRINLDRPNWAINPSSCAAMSVDVEARSSDGATDSLSNHFQVGSCGDLAFKPKLSLSLSGPTHRSGHPKLRAVLTPRPGDANIGRVAVTLPGTEFLENAHIQTICTRIQYRANECPARSIYGYARAWSPLLDEPLEGPVYLRSSDHQLPDLVASLDGQIHVDVAGRIDSVHARIRNTFEAVPDAPVSRFVLTMQGGKKGLLVNNTELCNTTPRARTIFTGQNGKVHDSHPVVRTDCRRAHKK